MPTTAKTVGFLLGAFVGKDANKLPITRLLTLPIFEPSKCPTRARSFSNQKKRVVEPDFNGFEVLRQTFAGMPKPLYLQQMKNGAAPEKKSGIFLKKFLSSGFNEN